MNDLSANDIRTDIEQAETAMSKLGPAYLRLWKNLRIEPMQWTQQEYPDAGNTWVIAIKGSDCLCFNMVEGGWGWVSYSKWGELVEFHWEQDEIVHAICKLYFQLNQKDE